MAVLVARCPSCGVQVTAHRGDRNLWLGWLTSCDDCGEVLEFDRDGFLVNRAQT
jgi:predicted RNA-binding Zn-ribbon protein involved in translation (DUF1610 family)